MPKNACNMVSISVPQAARNYKLKAIHSVACPVAKFNHLSEILKYLQFVVEQKCNRSFE